MDLVQNIETVSLTDYSPMATKYVKCLQLQAIYSNNIPSVQYVWPGKELVAMSLLQQHNE